MNTQNDKATPRPWKAYNADSGRIFKNWAVGGKVDRIATIHDLGSSKAAQANAELIVRAINQYEALLAVAEAAEKVLRQCESANDANEGHRASLYAVDKLTNALSALAKLREGKE